MAKKKSRKKSKRRRIRRIRWITFFIGILLVIGIAVGIWAWNLPLPKPVLKSRSISIHATVNSIAWPNASESAIGAIGFNVLDSYGPQTQIPTASVAKLITALTVLKKYPLQIGQQGPMITLTATDVADYQMYLNEDGSVVRIVAGEQISEYQILEAMLLPSANDMADALATWAFGSLANYSVAANQYIASLGLTNTTVGSDASGFIPNTSSTASNLVELGETAIANPVISQIVSEKVATIPVVGLILNFNSLLGQDGIIGIKTGNTDQAGGVYVFAAKYSPVDTNNSVTIVGAIMGAPTLPAAINDAIPLLQSTKNNFQVVKVVAQDQILGEYSLPWQKNINVVSQNSINILAWGGASFQPTITFDKLHAPVAIGTSVGQISVIYNGTNYSSPLSLESSLSKAPWQWQLFRSSALVSN